MDTLATLQIPIKPDFPYGQDTLDHPSFEMGLKRDAAVLFVGIGIGWMLAKVLIGWLWVRDPAKFKAWADKNSKNFGFVARPTAASVKEE